MKAQSKGRSDGLHKSYFNGSPGHVGSKPNPAPANPPTLPGGATPKGC